MSYKRKTAKKNYIKTASHLKPHLTSVARREGFSYIFANPFFAYNTKPNKLSLGWKLKSAEKKIIQCWTKKDCKSPAIKAILKPLQKPNQSTQRPWTMFCGRFGPPRTQWHHKKIRLFFSGWDWLAVWSKDPKNNSKSH